MNRQQKGIAFAAVLMCAIGFYQLARAVSIERYTVGDVQVYELDQSGNQTVGGTQTVVGSQTVTGAQIVTGAQTNTGAVSFNNTLTSSAPVVLSPQAYTNLFGTNTIIPSSSFLVLTTSGGFPGDIKLLSTPNISTTTALNTTAAGTTSLPNGFTLTLIGSNTNQITLQDAGTLTNSGLNLLQPGQVITSTRTVELIYNSGRWTQIRGFAPN